MPPATLRVFAKFDPLDRLWQIASSWLVTLTLSLGAVTTLALALLGPRATDTVADAQSSVTPLSLLSGPAVTWAHLLLAVLGYNLVLRLAQHARQFVRGLRLRDDLPAAPYGAKIESATAPHSLTDTVTLMEEGLVRLFSRVVVQRGAGRGEFYAERHRWSAISPVLMAGGALLLLAGVAFNSLAGWQVPEVSLAPGRSVTFEPAGSRLQLELLDLTEGADDATIAILPARGGDRNVGIGSVRPSRLGNLWLIQRATGPLLAVTAREVDGQPLPLQSLAPGGDVGDSIQVLFRQTQTEQAFAIPTRDLTFRAVSYPSLPERGIAGQVFLVEAYRGVDATPFLTALLQEPAEYDLDGVIITFDPDRHVIISAVYLPGTVPCAAGLLAILAGLILTLGWGYTQVWAVLAPRGGSTEIGVGVTAPAGPYAARRLRRRLLDGVGAETEQALSSQVPA